MFVAMVSDPSAQVNAASFGASRQAHRPSVQEVDGTFGAFLVGISGTHVAT
jgi:hypothetical protein